MSQLHNASLPPDMHEAVLVTGGSNGIGAAIAERLLNDGVRVAIIDIEQPANTRANAFFKADMKDVTQTAAALQAAMQEFHFTGLVNNVGMVRPASVDEVSLDDFNDVMAVNVRAALQCIQAVLPAMRQVRYGRIVSISSRVVRGKERRVAYSASKGALDAMTRSLALEIAKDGVTINNVAPGPISTDAFNRNNPPDAPATKAILERVPMGYFGQPSDVANAVRFFLDKSTSFITGQTLNVCGGATLG